MGRRKADAPHDENGDLLATQDTLKRLARTPVKRLRLAFVPEYESLLAEVRWLHERVEELQHRTALLEDGLHESRRLNLRIAQLTDVVTELVLPLHQRDIDPAVFDTVADDAQ